MSTSDLECRETGRGTPVVFIHGSASDHRTWDAQVEAVGARFRSIAYSRRFHWPNAPIPDDADYDMETQVEDLRALLESIGDGPAHLVGHSYGALVALHLAMREPSLVRTLVLEEAPAIRLFVSNQPKPGELLRLLATRPRTALTLIRFGATGPGPATKAAKRGDVDEAMRMFGRAVLGRDVHARLSPERMEQVRANSFAAEFLGSGFPRLDPSAVARVTIPTLLIEGAKSPALFHRLNDRLAELMPHAARATVPRASHMMHEDNPGEFNATLLDFLANAG